LVRTQQAITVEFPVPKEGGVNQLRKKAGWGKNQRYNNGVSPVNKKNMLRGKKLHKLLDLGGE